MLTEQEKKDKYLLKSCIEYPKFVSEITLDNLAVQGFIDDSVFSSEGVRLEKVRLGKAEFMTQPDGSSQFVEFKNNPVKSQLSKKKELERQQLIEQEEHESAYFFRLIYLERKLVAEVNEIKLKQFLTEDSRYKSLRPYIKRLNEVRDILGPVEKKVSEIKRRHRLPSSLVLAVAGCLIENPDYKATDIYKLIYECSKPENEDEFYKKITIDSCTGCTSDSIFYWLDNEQNKPKPKPMKRTSFDGVVTKAKKYNKENYTIT